MRLIQSRQKPDNTDVKDVKVASYYDGWNIRLKNAYVDLDLIPLTTLRVGMIGTPWIPTVEKVWNYRFVKPTLTDAEKLFSSADMGAAATIKLPQGYGEAMLAVRSGFSVFGEVNFMKFLPTPLNNLGVLARFDSWDPNTDKENDGHSLILAGLTYAVAKNVRAVLNLQQTSYQATDKDSTSQITCQVEVKF